MSGGHPRRVDTWAVIATKNRHDLLRKCLASVADQIYATVIIDNNDRPDKEIADMPRVVVKHMPGYPPNLSEMINVGLDMVTICNALQPRWNVALLNDDVEVPAGWVNSLDDGLRDSGAALAYVDRLGRPESTLYQTTPVRPEESMTGWACLLRGEALLRWDEDLKWWYGDTDLDWRCRIEHGGVIAVPGEIPLHHHPSVQTDADPNLTRQAVLDGQTFAAKWAVRQQA